MKSTLFLLVSKSSFLVTIFADFMQIMYPQVHIITAEDLDDAREKTQHVKSYRIVTITDNDDEVLSCKGRLAKSRKTYVIDHDHILLDLNTIIRMELKGGGDEYRKVRVIIE